MDRTASGRSEGIRRGGAAGTVVGGLGGATRDRLVRVSRRREASRTLRWLAIGVLPALLAAAPAQAQNVCESAADCDDGIACTIDTCQDGFISFCKHTPDGVGCRLEFVSDSSTTCTRGNDDETSCLFTEELGASLAFGFESRYGWSLCADPDATHDRGVSGDARHALDFNVATRGGYRLDVTHSWKGYMKANSGTAFGGASDADVSEVQATWEGPGAVVPDLDWGPYEIHSVPGLPDPGHAHVDAAEIDTEGDAIDASASFSIYDRSHGFERTHQLIFDWDGHARGEQAYGSVRLGEGYWNPSLADSDDCLYPGSPSRGRIFDGHNVAVEVVPLCGNGQIDAEVGEECDPSDADNTCCTNDCMLCCGDGVANPGEACDPSIPGSNCPVVCDAFDFGTIADGPFGIGSDGWHTDQMSLVNSAAWAVDAADEVSPVHQRLRLTSPALGQKGSAWYNSGRVDPTRDWSANFSFQLTFANNDGADGLSMILQRDGLAADFDSGTEGAPTAGSYLAIGVDTFRNQSDAFDEGLEVHVNGTSRRPMGSSTDSLSLSNANFSGCAGNLQDCIYNLYASYTAATKQLVVTVTSPNHPGGVSGTWNLDLAALLGNYGDYLAGFAANTGGAGENHDVLRWAFVFSSSCGDGVVQADEQCDTGAANGTSGSCCSSSCGIKPSGTSCAADGNLCTTEQCNGTSATCQHVNNTAVCDDGVYCNGTDRCSGGSCVHDGDPCPGADGDENCGESCDEASHTCTAPDPAGTICRDSAGTCDVVEVCNGSSASCPPDAFKSSATECRGAAGVCDAAETCTGSSASCPADGFKSSVVQCRVPAGICDVAETCTGSSAACPTDRFQATSTCRVSAGVCDKAEICNGLSAVCPPDTFWGPATQCRAAAGVCDAAETCTGSSASCPADLFKSAMNVCRPAAGDCDVAESCSGGSASCPSDQLATAATLCRASSGECDPEELCTGGAAACPADSIAATGTPCTEDGDLCTLDACDDGGLCAHGQPADGDGDGSCDSQDPCTNVSGARDFLTPPRSVLKLSRINTQTTPDDDTMVLSGVFDLPAGRSFADLQPDANGARMVLLAQDGTSRADVALAGGAYGGKGTRGWKLSGNRKSWTFLDRTGAPANGIAGLKLRDVAKSSEPNRVRVKITGKSGSYPVTPSDLPLTAFVVLGNQADAAAGLCGESAFDAPDCEANGRQDAVTCRR